MDLDLTNDRNATARELDSLVDEVDALREEIDSINARSALVIQRQINRVLDGLRQLDPNRPATLRLINDTVLVGAVTFGTLSGFVHNGSGPYRFDHGAVVSIHQDEVGAPLFVTV